MQKVHNNFSLRILYDSLDILAADTICYLRLDITNMKRDIYISGLHVSTTTVIMLARNDKNNTNPLPQTNEKKKSSKQSDKDNSYL